MKPNLQTVVIFGEGLTDDSDMGLGIHFEEDGLTNIVTAKVRGTLGKRVSSVRIMAQLNHVPHCIQFEHTRWCPSPANEVLSYYFCPSYMDSNIYSDHFLFPLMLPGHRDGLLHVIQASARLGNTHMQCQRCNVCDAAAKWRRCGGDACM